MTQRKLSEIAGQKVSQKDLVSLNGGTVLDEIARVFEYSGLIGFIGICTSKTKRFYIILSSS